MNTSNSFAWFVTMLMAVVFGLSIMGCGVGVPTKAEINVVRSQDVTIDDDDKVSMAPRRLLEEVTKEIKNTYANIELVDGLLFRDTAFPEGGWRLKELLVPEVRRRVNEQLNLDYLALVGTIETSQNEEKGFMFPMLLGAMSAEGASTITAIIIDLRTGELVSKIVSEARGTTHIYHYVIIVAGNEPQTDSGAVEGLANEIGKVITELAKSGKTRLTVLALEDFGTSNNTTENKEVEPLSEEQLLSEAETGNTQAQWQLYKHKELRGKYKRLCEAAEQGDYRAQWELGYLHANGLYGVRKDLVLSAMWYGLVESAGHNPGGVDTIRERLTLEQRIKAEHLYENWNPGQCEREIFGIESNTN